MEDNSNWGLSVIQMDIVNEENLKTVACSKFIYPMEIERNMICHIADLDMEAVREDLREFEEYLKKQVYHYADIREAMPVSYTHLQRGKTELCFCVSVQTGRQATAWDRWSAIN